MVSEVIDSMSFPDDESTGMAQATPTATLPNQMPRQKPMMDPRMMQQMMMASKMNPQMGNRMMAAMGGRMNYAEGGDEGELLDMGGMEGAEIMENMMTNLENGGKVSKGSQGLDGAREMFATQQRLGEVL